MESPRIDVSECECGIRKDELAEQRIPDDQVVDGMNEYRSPQRPRAQECTGEDHTADEGDNEVRVVAREERRAQRGGHEHSPAALPRAKEEAAKQDLLQDRRDKRSNNYKR